MPVPSAAASAATPIPPTTQLATRRRWRRRRGHDGRRRRRRRRLGRVAAPLEVLDARLDEVAVGRVGFGDEIFLQGVDGVVVLLEALVADGDVVQEVGAARE